MKVNELIEKLKTYNPEAEVVVSSQLEKLSVPTIISIHKGKSNDTMECNRVWIIAEEDCSGYNQK